MPQASSRDNPFLTYVSEHPDADAQALKELFRILAKRTHPDTSNADRKSFVRLQELYHEALARMADLEPTPRTGSTQGTQDASPRELMLVALYRYKSLLPTMEIDARVPDRAGAALKSAIAAAEEYRAEAKGALESFASEFHARRQLLVRFPDVRTKYRSLMKGIGSFFDYQWMPNAYNLRLARSYLEELHPVTDYDPTGSPELRSNRSAPARSALYRMRTMLEYEISLPVAELVI